jgi:hypothetical protein
VRCLKAALLLILFFQKLEAKARKTLNLIQRLRYPLERLEPLERFERFLFQMRAVRNRDD